MQKQKILSDLAEKFRNGSVAVDALSNIFRGRSALVISAGPSATNWKQVYKKMGDKNPVVFCVKQAINLPGASSVCDVHFINAYNLEKFKYENRKPFIIFSDASDGPNTYQDYDLRFEVVKDSNADLKSTLAYNCNFDEWLISKTGTVRPWGPGIMHEVVLFSLLHMGFKEIYTVGWDIADLSGKNRHFYDKKRSASFEDFLYKVLLKIFPAHFINYSFFLLGKKYNRASMIDGEAEVTSCSIERLRYWLNSHDVEINIFSNSQWMKD